MPCGCPMGKSCGGVRPNQTSSSWSLLYHEHENVLVNAVPQMLRFPLEKSCPSFCFRAKSSDDALQSLLRLLRHHGELCVADAAEHGLRVGDINATSCPVRAHNDITGQQQTDVWFLCERAMGQRRVAGSQDDVEVRLGSLRK